nr:MAG TPA: hypothetical protein [Caudoviricetes sp.]
MIHYKTMLRSCNMTHSLRLLLYKFMIRSDILFQ